MLKNANKGSVRRWRVSPSVVISLFALVIALSTGAYAAVTIAPENSVVSKSIKNQNVKTNDLAASAVSTKKLKDGSVGTAQLKDEAVTKSKFADDVLTVGPAGPQGVAGPIGPAGPIGLTGPRGPAGPAGGPLDPTRIVHTWGPIITIQPGAQFINVAAPCPGDAIALSGGYGITGSVQVTGSGATDFQESWAIEVRNPGGEAGTARAFTLCLTI